MKKIILGLILVFSSLQGFSQNVEKAKQILNKVSATLGKYQNLEISFKHKLENKAAKINQTSTGNAIIEKNKYVLNYLGNTILFDLKNSYVISPENEEVNITPAKEIDQEEMSPSKLLYFYKSGYSYALDAKKVVAGKTIQYIKLVPLKKSDIAYVLLGINLANYHIENLKEVGKNGTTTAFEILSYKTNQKLAANTFVFNRKKYESLDYTINN